MNVEQFFLEPRRRRSQELAFEAERADDRGDVAAAIGHYAEAARLEEENALDVPGDVPRVRSVLGLSAVALWLRAEHGVQTDKKNRVIAWQDIALGSNRFSNDAFQPDYKSRPQYILDAFGGRPAIRFDGAAAYLTTTPMATTDNQTIVVMFQHAEPKNHR